MYTQVCFWTLRCVPLISLFIPVMPAFSNYYNLLRPLITSLVFHFQVDLAGPAQTLPNEFLERFDMGCQIWVGEASFDLYYKEYIE